jgi:aminoglycoside phosphotransferase (APT) family kinase protein
MSGEAGMDAPPGLDLQRLRVHLERERPGLVSGRLTAEIIAGGRSNLTYVIRDSPADHDRRQEWVLRRPPLGHVLATAHDMAREYRVMTALGPTAVPVPRTVLLCEDPEVLGAPFYLMERVAGTVVRHRGQLEAFGPERAGAIGDRLVDTLVDLHAVEITSAGLGDFGRPEGYLERQLRRWSRQLESSRNRDLPGVEELHSRLVAGMPAGAEGVVLHGDYRLDNVILGAHDEVAAVLDWEMSTLGDPLADVALLVAYRDRRTPSDDDPVGDATQAPGFPSAQDLVARYAERSGRDVSGLAWYVAFSYFKLAVILEGIHYRFIHGQTVGAGFDLVGEMVPGLVAAGLDWLRTERGEEREVR